MMATLVAFALQQPAAAPPPARADTSRGRPCVVEIDSIGHTYREVPIGPNQKSYHAGGGVLAHCQGTGTRLLTDSLAHYPAAGRSDLVGHVHIRDTTVTLDANFVSYFEADERLEAHNNVVAVNRFSGTTLRGPNLTYWRALPGIRDTIEMYATQRPHIDYRGAGASDTSEPYVIIADRVRLKGSERMWAGGSSTIDRSDFSARGDSILLDETTGIGVLIGSPRVEGKGSQRYTLTGTRIEMGLEGKDLKEVRALGTGRATSTDWVLTSDTINLFLEHRKLQQALAWGKQSRPHAVSALQDIRADSLALDVPDQVLTEGRGFGHAFSASKHDSATAAVKAECAADNADCLVSCMRPLLDCIAGDTLTARWAQEAVPGGQPRSRVHRIIAIGSARSLTHQTSRDTTSGGRPTLNYSRGKRIDVVLKQARVDSIMVGGRADGVSLEPKPPARDTTKRDSINADPTVKKDST